MAPMRPLGNPPPVSSSDEDEEESSDEEVVEKQEEEELEQEEEGEQEEEEEEEEEEEQEEEEPLVKSKAARELTKKRPAETLKSPGTSKKRRKGLAPPLSFQRIWSDEDVIALLEGIIEFKKEKGVDPSTYMAGFCEHVKDAIHINVSKNQMSDKIRGLRKKYLNNAKRGKDGEDPVFSKPHDHKTFQLSKLVFGSNGSIADGVNKSKNKSSTSASKPEKSLEESLDAKVLANADEFWTSYPSLNKLMESLPPRQRSSMKDGMKLVSRSKVKEMDDEWHKFNMKEYGLYMEQTQLFLDVSRAIGLGQGK